MKKKKRKEKIRTFWADFKKFITRGNVVDMAIGVAVASAFTAIVTAFTAGFISPLLALLTNHSDLSSMQYVIREAVVEVVDGVETVVTPEVALKWGSFLQKIIDFLIIAFFLFLVLRIASAVMAHSKKIREKMYNAIYEEQLKAEAEKKAEEERVLAEKAAAEEAKRLELEAAIQKEKDEQKQRLTHEIELLTEIRDLIKQNKEEEQKTEE